MRTGPSALRICHKDVQSRRQAARGPHRCHAERPSSGHHTKRAAPGKRLFDGNPAGVAHMTYTTYQNRRAGSRSRSTPPATLHTGTSTYVTRSGPLRHGQDGEDFVVYDARPANITRSVWPRSSSSRRTGRQNLLPSAFRRQLIRFYGASMPMLVPPIAKSHRIAHRGAGDFRNQMAHAFGGSPVRRAGGTVRRNMECSSAPSSMSTPFARRESGGSGTHPPEKPAARAARARRSHTRLARCGAGSKLTEVRRRNPPH